MKSNKFSTASLLYYTLVTHKHIVSCERHCEPGSVIRKLKKFGTYEPGAFSQSANQVAIREQHEIRQTENIKRFEETEKMAKNLISQMPPDLRYPVSVRDDDSPNGVKNYEIYIAGVNDSKIGYTSSPEQKIKWVNYTSFCIFTHLFKRNEDGHSVIDQERVSQLTSDLPQVHQTAA